MMMRHSDQASSSGSSSFTGRLNSLMARGVQGERESTQVPLSQEYSRSSTYFRIGQHSDSLNEMQLSMLFRLVSLTLMILGFCFSKPMNPILMFSTPAMRPSQIHFCTLQLLARYSWKTSVPWVFFMSSIHPPSVVVSMKDRMRQGSAEPSDLTFMPSMRTAVQMSMSSNWIFTYFFMCSSCSSSSASPASSSSPSGSTSSSLSVSPVWQTSPEASRSLKTCVFLVAVQQCSLILDQSEGMLPVVFSLVVNMSRQVSSFSSSPLDLQFSNRIRLPSFSTWMPQGYCPPLTVRIASRNSIEQTNDFRMGSSLFIKPVAISASDPSARVLTDLTLYSSFSLKPTGFQEMRSTFSLSLWSLPCRLISSIFILPILGMCSERSRLLMVLTLVQSFLTVISLNLVLYWLCQVRSPRRCFLVKVRVLARLFLRRSPILMFLEMKSLLVTLVLPSTTVYSSSSLRMGTLARLQHLICVLLKRLKQVSGMCSYSSWANSQLIHSFSSTLKSYSTLRSTSIVVDLMIQLHSTHSNQF